MSTSTRGLGKLAAALRDIPRTLGLAVAAKVAPEITRQAVSAYKSGRTVYGDARPLGVSGQALTLHKSGRLAAGLLFTAIGTRVRAVLSVPWAKYQIRFGILPNGKAALPVAWQESIASIARDEIGKGLG